MIWLFTMTRLFSGDLQFLPGIAVKTIGIDRRDVTPEAFDDLLPLRFGQSGPDDLARSGRPPDGGTAHNRGSGVSGFADLSDGIHGESQSNQHAGVSGINNSGDPGVAGVVEAGGAGARCDAGNLARRSSALPRIRQLGSRLLAAWGAARQRSGTPLRRRARPA